MPMKIRKIKDEMEIDNMEKQAFDLKDLLPFLQNSPFFTLSDSVSQSDKNTLNKIWINSQSIDNNRIKISSNIPQQDISILKSKGLINVNGDIAEFTKSGQKALKETILGDEKSSFDTFKKQASKKLISKNSYDFGENVLVKIQHPNKFGTKYINISKQAFVKKNIEPIKIEEYNITPRHSNGEYKTIDEYSDNEMIHLLHLSNKIVKNASFLAKETGTVIPVHMIKSFAGMIMEILNK